MNKEPFFSVVIPLYNKEKDIAATLQSVLDQSYNNFEVIIVNDGSTDRGPTIVEDFLDDRIKIFHTSNLGVSSARNLGIEMSVGEHVAFLDGDDCWYPNHLMEISSLIIRFPKARWFATVYEFVEANGDIHLPISSLIGGESNWSDGMCNYFKHSLGNSIVSSSSVCFIKSFIQELDGFRDFIDTGQDTDLWIRAGIEEELCFTNKVTVSYMLGATNRITNKANHTKRHMNLDLFLEMEETDIWLHKFINIYRVLHIIKFTLDGDMLKAKEYRSHLDFSVLSTKQKFLLSLNNKILRFVYSVKKIINLAGIRPRISNR